MIEVKENKETINHPSHYNRPGSMECINEMLLIFGKEAVKHFCLLNAWKYRYRAADKNGEEDLKKSDWYLHKYAELCGLTPTIKENKDDDPDWIIPQEEIDIIKLYGQN